MRSLYVAVIAALILSMGLAVPADAQTDPGGSSAFGDLEDTNGYDFKSHYQVGFEEPGLTEGIQKLNGDTIESLWDMGMNFTSMGYAAIAKSHNTDGSGLAGTFGEIGYQLSGPLSALFGLGLGAGVLMTGLQWMRGQQARSARNLMFTYLAVLFWLFLLGPINGQQGPGITTEYQQLVTTISSNGQELGVALQEEVTSGVLAANGCDQEPDPVACNAKATAMARVTTGYDLIQWGQIFEPGSACADARNEVIAQGDSLSPGEVADHMDDAGCTNAAEHFRTPTASRAMLAFVFLNSSAVTMIGDLAWAVLVFATLTMLGLAILSGPFVAPFLALPDKHRAPFVKWVTKLVVAYLMIGAIGLFYGLIIVVSHAIVGELDDWPSIFKLCVPPGVTFLMVFAVIRANRAISNHASQVASASTAAGVADTSHQDVQQISDGITRFTKDAAKRLKTT